MKRSRTSLVLLACLASVCGFHTAAAQNVPSFQNAGVLLPSGDAASEWSEASAVAWTADLEGYGQSSPVVWDGQVYVTSVVGPMKDEYIVTALRLSDGEEMWKFRTENPAPRENTGFVSKAAPTPAVDTNGVICLFDEGSLVALDHEGNVRWQRNLIEEYGAIGAQFGLGSSLEQTDSLIYAWIERDEEPYILAVEKATGENRWKQPGLGATSWATPRLLSVDGGRHLVLSGGGKIAGLDPQTGQRLWTFEGIAENTAITPILAGDGKFLIGAATSAGGDGAGSSRGSNGLIQVERDDAGNWSADFAWRAERATSSFGSPIAHEGLAYFVNRSGVLFGIDLASGEEVYAERIGDSVWATPIASGDHIYFFQQGGNTAIVASGREFRQLGDIPWPADEAPPVLYAAVAAGNRLLLRGGSRLVCLMAVETDGE